MLEPSFISRFTIHLKEALQKALTFCVASGRDLVEPGDLLVGLLQEDGSIGKELLQKAKLKIDVAETAFRNAPTIETKGETVTPDLSGPVKKILERCILLAHLHDHKYVGTEHLVASIVAINPPEIELFFKEQNINASQLKEHAASILSSTSKFPNIQPPPFPMMLDEEIDLPQIFPNGKPQQQNGRRGQNSMSAIETFSQDLTHPETVANLDPVIGRERELNRVIEILCRRSKNNPILLGEPGVGKTAIVEGLAQKLASGDVPDALYGKRILSVDLALTVAGTMYRGEFEARLKQLVDEVKNDPDAILFIDEIHTIVGAGSTSGSLDAANILKPALSRGEIRCIGATTWAEYKKHIEPDAALERRFQPVSVEEPSAEETRTMINGLRERYEKHHGVQYEDAALDAAVSMAERYLTDRKFPDKAIDLIDESAASVISKRKNREVMERLRALDIAHSEAEMRKEDAVTGQLLEEAQKHKEAGETLLKEYDAVRKDLEAKQTKDITWVRANDVASVIARIANVPIETVLATERERMRDIGQRLENHIIGQSRAIETVADAIRKAKLGLGDERRPRVSMLFAGPSGTGKTELARKLAVEIFGKEDALLKLDMSEFAEGYSASKLLGSPAGYVGYREANKFTDALRKRPHCVVCFDEIEKAHPDTLNILLQLLEDGQVTDATGRPVSFRQAYIILTSNVGADSAIKKSLGFEEEIIVGDRFDAMIRSDVEERFRPELINRLDHIVVFHPLSNENMKEIVRRELYSALARVERAQNIACGAGDDVLEWLMSRPMPQKEGARAARRLIEREVTHILGRILSERPNKKTIQLKATKNGLKAV